MTTFDRWEGAVQPPEDYLMHFRTKGSKNGIRRYQTESGEWTPLGLAERRKREGFGESRKERKAQRQVQRAERKQARKAAATARRAERAEAMRKRSLKGLTDAEMKQKLERAKMEAEYRDLKRKGSLIETGANLVSKYLDYKEKKEQRTIDENRQKIDMMNAKANLTRAKESAKTAKAEARKAKFGAKEAKQERKGGKKYERKAQLTNARTQYRNTTIRGAIGKHFNNMSKYRQELRMNPIEAKKHQRAREMAEIALEREKAKKK